MNAKGSPGGQTRKRRSAVPPRERLVVTAAQLFRAKGVTGTGTLEILTAAEAARGSLYHYFPGGKPQLVEEALQCEAARVSADLQRLIDTGADVPAVLEAFTDALADSLESSDFRLGCPVTTAALELSADDAAIRAVCANAYRMWQTMIETLLLARSSDGGQGATAAADAELILSTIEGGLLLARAQQDGDVLRRIVHNLARRISSHPEA